MSSVMATEDSLGSSESPNASEVGWRRDASTPDNAGAFTSGRKAFPEQQDPDQIPQPYDPAISGSQMSLGADPSRSGSPEGLRDRRHNNSNYQRSVSRDRGRNASILRRTSFASELPGNVDYLDRAEKGDQKPYAADVSTKLGTFSGVFVPTTLNVLSILMFLRFGFILGQSGVLGMMVMLIVAYLINTVTTMSISAIATNGTVRGGGAYYLVSRSLGPEFGGSIGIVLYLGFVLNTGMNAAGLIDVLAQDFGSLSGSLSNFLHEGFWWQYLWGTIVLVLCTGVCLAGSSTFARASNGLLAILLIATFSIPLSAIVKSPFSNGRLGVDFTGLDWETFVGNLKPQLTQGAAGSQSAGKENFRDLFGILFPATGGIFAGASMSGDLNNPSKSIPKGTLYGLGTTFFSYSLVVLAIAATVTRQSLYRDVNVIQDTNLSRAVVFLGEFATTFFSSIMGVIGAAKLLQAIARDTLIPGISIFCKGTEKSGEPTIAIIFTFVVAQITMLFDINRIATFITMTYLMTFLATNLACFLLEVGSAPNFRPAFRYFNSWTALAGTVVSGVSMFFVDGIYAAGCICVFMLLFLLIHYTTPPKPWGDVSQSLIYHQVRKYLLRLRPEHVKFWRPQILLFVNDFEAQYKMIHFCNSLKKGALFVLGRVIVTQDFSNTVPNIRKEQAAWTKFVEWSKVKAFTNVSVAPSVEWGIRNVVLSSGLGGMRPNIVIIGEYRKDHVDHITPEIANKPQPRRGSRAGEQPGEDGRWAKDNANWPEATTTKTMNVQSYLTVLEDLLFKLRINVAVARGFEELELPDRHGRNTKTHIDLWPIQMSAQIATNDTGETQNLTTTNFDTYTLILQLGCILHTVPSWKRTYLIRVAVFVEYESDIEEERGRVETLLEKLRMEGEVLVFCLSDLQTYRIIVNGERPAGAEDKLKQVDSVLEGEDWWHEMKAFQHGAGKAPKNRLAQVARLAGAAAAWSKRQRARRFDQLRNIMESSKRRKSMGHRSVSFGMQTHRLLDSMVDYHSDGSEQSSGEESDMEQYESESEGDMEPSPTAASSSEEQLADNSKTAQQGWASQKKQKLRKMLQQPRQQTQDTTSETAVTDEESDESDNNNEDSAPARQATAVEIPATTRTPPQDEGPAKAKSPEYRPPLPREQSTARFSSSPIPETKVAAEEGTGPSIMFADSSSTSQASSGSNGQRESIYRRTAPSSAAAASEPGSNYYAHQPPITFSFNDLPCRAQHLILNELIKKHSDKTAVVFTTLPSPIEGTCRDKDASESFVSNLDVLYDGLPPCLLVHSNSMTVTMDL